MVPYLRKKPTGRFTRKRFPKPAGRPSARSGGRGCGKSRAAVDIREGA